MAWSTFEHKGFLRVRFYSQPFPCNAQDCTLIQNTFKIKILLFYPSLYNISKRITKSTTTRFVRKRYRNKEREINQIYVLDRREIPSETIPAWQPILQNHQLQMYSVQKLKYIYHCASYLPVSRKGLSRQSLWELNSMNFPWISMRMNCTNKNLSNWSALFLEQNIHFSSA